MPTDLTAAIAAIHYERDFDINGTLRLVVKRLQADRVKVGGVLQTAAVLPNQCCARLFIVDIRTGQTECISQDRGPESRGCKLDPRGLAEISHCLVAAIEDRVDLLVINKFGRAESEGGGLLSLIGTAISEGIPVLTTVRQPYTEAWASFHGGLAKTLSPCVDAVVRWFESSCQPREHLASPEVWRPSECL